MDTLTLNRKKIKTKSITIVLAVVISLVLPQIFHAVGIVSGLGSALGAAFLPIQIPVLIAGFMAGPIVGIIVGLASPLISFAISGMPVAALVPFMMIEVAGYGIAAGMISKTKMPIFFKVVIVQLAGRTLRAVAILFAIFALGNQAITTPQIWNIVVAGLPGILLQWAIVPLLLYRMEWLKKYYE